ncbi:MAG: M20/M25/M40 family metallo-hydrolase [Saprospiraceae bacterium]
MDKEVIYWQHEAVALLKELIETPSFSKEEDRTATVLMNFLEKHQARPQRVLNNVFAVSKNFNPAKPTILLNSHHDTVKPNSNYTKDPFKALVEEGKLYGLGSNDAGGPLVSLICTFLYLNDKSLSYNLIIAATAEEEISGKNGIEYLLAQDATIFPFAGKGDDFGIVGEPTLMQLAIAERGLMVIDAQTEGKAGHAAREEGDNALMKTIHDLANLDVVKLFTKVSDFLGPVKITPTVIHTENKAHNVVPATCNYVLDCRINELYAFEEVLKILQENLHATLKPRSTRLKSSIIQKDHPIVLAGIEMGKTPYGSPTTSDKALMPFPALKMGPGDSARSHSPNEFIYLEEIHKGIEDYITLIKMVASPA